MDGDQENRETGGRLVLGGATPLPDRRLRMAGLDAMFPDALLLGGRRTAADQFSPAGGP